MTQPQERSIGRSEGRSSGRHMRAAAGPGPEDGRGGRRFKKLIGRAMLEQRLESQRVELVSRTVGSVEANDRRAGERQIADRVERLVTHELVGVAQPFWIEDSVTI